MTDDEISTVELAKFMGTVETKLGDLGDKIDSLDESSGVLFAKVEKQNKVMIDYVSSCNSEHRKIETGFNDDVMELKSFKGRAEGYIRGAYALLLIVAAEFVHRMLGGR